MTALSAQAHSQPISLKEAIICFAAAPRVSSVSAGRRRRQLFILGLQPRHTYQVEIDDEEVFGPNTDRDARILELDVPRGKPVGVRIKESPRATAGAN